VGPVGIEPTTCGLKGSILLIFDRQFSVQYFRKTSGKTQAEKPSAILTCPLKRVHLKDQIMDKLKGGRSLLAEEIPKKDAGARIGGVNTVRTGYSAYAVAGNVVMMCEQELSSCETLINALEAS
jgi:hypothetical protein